LPRTFTRGLLFHLLYALALVVVSYFLFKKSLFRLNEDKNKQLAPGDIRVIDFLCLVLSLLNQPREQKQKLLKRLELSGFKHKRFNQVPG
jgi:hypothetical protein